MKKKKKIQISDNKLIMMKIKNIVMYVMYTGSNKEKSVFKYIILLQLEFQKLSLYIYLQCKVVSILFEA